VLTQTRPGPPPGAGVAVKPAAALVVAADAGTAREGVAEVFGLNKSASVFFAGVGDGLTAEAAAAFVLRPRFPVSEGDASVPAAGEAEVAAVVLALRFGFSAVEGDAPVVAAGEPAVSAEAASLAAFFLCPRCAVVVGDSAGDGDCPLTIHTVTRPAISKTRSFVFIIRGYRNDEETNRKK
jgi:hypothetical protein